MTPIPSGYRITRHGLRPDWYTEAEDPPDLHHVFLAKLYLAENFDAARTRHYCSYALKGEVEREVGEYITNGALIQAAAELDFILTPRQTNARIFIKACDSRRRRLREEDLTGRWSLVR